MRDLEIAWRRLVDEKGETCPRHRGTGRWVRLAVHLRRLLFGPRGIPVGLQENTLSSFRHRHGIITLAEVESV